MFKKNPNRPPMVLNLKKIQGGYKVIPNEGHSLFQVKRIIRTICRRTFSMIQLTWCLKDQGFVWNKTAWRFLALLSNLLRILLFLPFLLGSLWQTFTKYKKMLFLNFLKKKNKSFPFPLEIGTPNYTNFIATLWSECGSKTSKSIFLLHNVGALLLAMWVL